MKVLERSIATEIGYGLDRYGGGASLGTTAKRKIKIFVDQRDSLTKFRQSFASLCKKHGLLSEEGTRWMTKVDGGLPGNMTPACERLTRLLDKSFAELETGLNQVSNEFGKRRRPRIPSEVAFQLVRLLESCKNSRTEADVLKGLVTPDGHLDSLVRKITREQKGHASARATESLVAKQNVLGRVTVQSEIRKIKSKIVSTKREARRIEKFKTRWNPFDVSRDTERPNWINQLKTQLINSILSEEEPKIAKKLTPEQRVKKKALMRDIAMGKYTNPRAARAIKEHLAVLQRLSKSFD